MSKVKKGKSLGVVLRHIDLNPEVVENSKDFISPKEIKELEEKLPKHHQGVRLLEMNTENNKLTVTISGLETPANYHNKAVLVLVSIFIGKSTYPIAAVPVEMTELGTCQVIGVIEDFESVINRATFNELVNCFDLIEKNKDHGKNVLGFTFQRALYNNCESATLHRQAFDKYHAQTREKVEPYYLGAYTAFFENAVIIGCPPTTAGREMIVGAGESSHVCLISNTDSSLQKAIVATKKSGIVFQYDSKFDEAIPKQLDSAKKKFTNAVIAVFDEVIDGKTKLCFVLNRGWQRKILTEVFMGKFQANAFGKTGTPSMTIFENSRDI